MSLPDTSLWIVLVVAALGAPWLALALMLAAGPARPWLPAGAALPALACALLVPDGVAITLSLGTVEVGFGIDAVNRVFLVAAALIWAVAGWHAALEQGSPAAQPRFAVPWLLALGGSLSLILAQELLGFYTAMAVMSFASWGLVVHDRSEGARSAGRLYLGMMMVGEVAMFTGIALLAATSGSDPFAFDAVAQAPGPAMALFGVGFAVKLGVLGVHAWLPRAHPAAPPAASAVLSGVMIKAGLLGWWRITEGVVGTLPTLGAFLVALGLVGAFYAVARGLVQNSAKTILAWSSVSQMGLITLLAGTALMTPDAATAAWTALAVFVLHHGLNKGALFLCAGLTSVGTTALRTLGWLLLWPPALALAGAPLTAGALTKSAVENAVYTIPGGTPIAALLYLSSLATTLLMLRLLWCARPRSWRVVPVALWRPLLPATLLVILGVALPWSWLAGSDAAAATLSGAGVWGATWPMGLAVAVALVVGYRGDLASARLARLPRSAPWDSLETQGRRQLVRLTTWERQLQQWSTIGQALLAVVLLIGTVTILEGLW